MYACMHECMYVCNYVCMYACMYVTMCRIADLRARNQCRRGSAAAEQHSAFRPVLCLCHMFMFDLWHSTRTCIRHRRSTRTCIRMSQSIKNMNIRLHLVCSLYVSVSVICIHTIHTLCVCVCVCVCVCACVCVCIYIYIHTRMYIQVYSYMCIH